MSPSDWERKASHADAQAEQLAAEGRIADAVVLSVQAQRYREVAEEMRRTLTGRPQRRTVRTVETPVDTTGQPGIVKRAAARARRHHAAQAALYGAGVTIQALADHLGEKRARVSHWMAQENASKNMPRPIPRVHADALDKGIRIQKADGKTVTLRIPRDAWRRIGE
jgi:hypothetical protein